ncbi:transposase IS111A/IS1328/IS1533 [Streptomyces azureus]|uniref:Transposase IS111A/IS1328/IS1533 n=1 Tax=Streptomyces azureus TaxID=146537 RepID=A0A0K8PPM0_STRAJ|nr:transposase IS111A/IS1328/IS1533 [Streptomyces azureus]
MTLPPPALPELSTGNRGTRRRAPVSDRPATSSVTGLSLLDNSRHEGAWAADIHPWVRGRGMDHPHATRVPARARARVIHRCWLDHEPNDPARDGAVRHFLAQPELVQAARG